MYNPFIPLTEELLYAFRNEGLNYLILQRFSWPGLKPSTTFLVTAYVYMSVALEHEQNLELKEGKLVDISTEFDKVLALLTPGNPYRLYVNMFPETNWEKHMLKEYKWKIQNYLANKTSLRPREKIDITFKLRYGRMIAEITGKDTSWEVPAFELIK